MKQFNAIASYGDYNIRMGKAIIDKMFFVDKIDPAVIVDYGCADGLLLAYLSHWYPDARLIGYDNDPRMCDHARKLLCEHGIKAEVYSDFDKVVHETGGGGFGVKKPVALVLSSIIHEVYTYSEARDIDVFWKTVFETTFDTVVVRDMMPCRSIDRPSNINDLRKLYARFLATKELKDFEAVHGSVSNNKALTHFCLKYKYFTPNWDRECKENYLPLYWEDFLALIPPQYNVIYHEHYVLPYVKRYVAQELGIELKDNTHCKFILERQ